MTKAAVAKATPTYPLRTAARLTGVSPELLRAWEKRYRVVEPLRTPGGTRRYRAADLERLKLVKSAVDAGHRIGQVAHLGKDELEALCREDPAPAGNGFEEILAALDRLDASETQRLLGLQLSLLGASRFAREFALPLVHQIGERWASGKMSIAAEHLASSVLSSMLGSALRPDSAAQQGPSIVFATPSGEPHQLGLYMAALTAMGAGANPIYLGADLPVPDLVAACEQTGAAALALSLVTLSTADATRELKALRAGLPETVHLWVGGSAAETIDLPVGIERIASLERLEDHVMLLRYATPGSR
jgi:DNA-binding transcriptional MerR regulator